MKILFIIDYGTPTGGAEIMILALRDGMRARGHDARLFTSSARQSNVTSLADYECFGTLGSWRTTLQSYNPWSKRELHRVLKEFQPDVVHVKLFLTQLSPSILPLLKDIPSLFHVVWYRAVCPLGTKTLTNLKPCTDKVGLACWENGCLGGTEWPLLMGQMKLWRKWLGVFDRIVPISVAVKDALTFEGISSEEPIFNGVPVRPMRQTVQEQPTVVFAGRLVKEKGVDVLLSAISVVLKHIPNARLLIAGDGPERISLQQQVERLGIRSRVEFAGHLSQDVMEQRLESAWVQVVCSRWAEPFGMTAIEAMMRGVPVIASHTGGLAEIVEHEKSGLLVPPGEVPALAKAMLNLLSDRDRAIAMGGAGRERAISKFDLETCLDQFERIYQEILTKPKTTVGRANHSVSESPSAGKM